MRDETAAAFRAALEDRLRAAAPAGDASLVRLRRLVIFDRLLARLLVVAPDRWVLKGGLALDLRLAPQARATKDMDLGHDGDEDAATSDFLDAQATDVGDLFALAIERTDNRDAALEGNAVRYRISARLAGRRFGEAIVDVGFGDPPVADPDVLEGPRLLAFAGFEPIRVPALPLERHVAEKVHAYTRPYPGQRRSSRVKDLVDLVLIRSAAAVDAGRLREAIGGRSPNGGRTPCRRRCHHPHRIGDRRIAPRPQRRASIPISSSGTGWRRPSSIPSWVTRWRTGRGGNRRVGPGNRTGRKLRALTDPRRRGRRASGWGGGRRRE